MTGLELPPDMKAFVDLAESESRCPVQRIKKFFKRKTKPAKTEVLT